LELDLIQISTRRCIFIKDLQINEEIRDREVRLIGPDGEALGIVPLAKAMELADENKLDLVKIAPKAEPPVCKIQDYGKFRYEQEKKKKEAKKNQKMVVVKEVRLSARIEEHDFNTKLKRAIKFLENENKVKVSVRFRGRELGFTDPGREMLLRFAKETEEIAVVERRPVMEGRSMIMILAPNKK
jgi:translation initiation factor IF-3